MMSGFSEAEQTGHVSQHNAMAWDALVRQEAALTQPASDKEFANPLKTVDPLGWLGDSLTGQHVLCLAAGGGRQSALYAAAGAKVTVVDISNEMLARDRAVAQERGLAIRALEGSMENLSMLAAGEFDVVIHPVSSCYLPKIQDTYESVARVLRPGGLYVSQHKSPTSLQVALSPEEHGYQLVEPYYRSGPLPTPTTPSRIRESGTLEFLHRWEELIGGMCRAGFTIEDLVEPYHVDPSGDRGSFGHRARYVAPYVRIKARRTAEVGREGRKLIELA
jgi:SAM-dependent methyltransferase